MSKKGRVRRALDRAINKRADHKNFIAFHNGLTVVCGKIDDSDNSRLVVKHLSVVNGAQSTIAFRENAAFITDDLRVVVKFVEVPQEKQLAREVAIRSNTQNPVSPRNLRARDGIQLRLESEFATQYPQTIFETRPDATLNSIGHVIHNDEAAQLLCAVYNETPWIAVRRLSLFEAERYPTVFSVTTNASQIMLVDRISQRVQLGKARFPLEYLRSWRLTKLVGVYLVGQLLRTSTELSSILEQPRLTLVQSDLNERLDRLVRFAAAAMKTRREELASQNKVDDFKVDFKRESALRELAANARKTYVTYRTVET